jgi:head-tail adaptor
MSNNVRFKLNRGNVRKFLKSTDMMNVAENYANNIKGRCGDGFETDKYVSFDRVHATVYASSSEARAKNSRENTLLKNVR